MYNKNFIFCCLSLLSASTIAFSGCSTTVPESQKVSISTNEHISTISQFNELMDSMAMNLIPSFSFSCSGSTAHMVTSSYWGDYSGTYRISNTGGKSTVTLDYPPYIRILAAHTNPALENQLTSREKSALREAQRLTKKLRPSDGNRFEHLVNIHDYIVKEYKTDLQGSDFATDLLLDECGACWAHSRAFYLLARMGGIPCHIVNGHAGGTAHSWNIIQMNNGEWYHLDTTWDDPITRGGDAGDTIEYHRYFLVCDNHLSRTHSWNRTPFPKSGSNHVTYFVNRNLVFHNSADFWEAARNAFYRGKFEFEGWMSPFNENEFRAGMKKLLQEDDNMRSCGWIAPKGAEGSVRVLFN